MTHTFKYKQAIVVRADLKMSQAKFGVEIAHASVGAIYQTLANPIEISAYLSKETLSGWFSEGFRKIILKVPSDKEILQLERKCKDLHIPHFVVYDFGLTELEPNTLTCIGIGPDLNENVDKVTGRLRLWK